MCIKHFPMVRTALCALVLSTAMSGCAVRGGDGVWRSIENIPASKDVTTAAGQARLEQRFLDSRICKVRAVIENNSARTETFAVSTFRQVNGEWIPGSELVRVPPNEARHVDANLVSSRPAAISRIIHERSRESIQIPVGPWCASFFDGDGNRYRDGYTFTNRRSGYGVFKPGLAGRRGR